MAISCMGDLPPPNGPLSHGPFEPASAAKRHLKVFILTKVLQLSMAPELRPSKRRKKDVPPQLGPRVHEKGPELQIRLTKGQAEQLGLERTTFMEFEKIEYVTFNSDNADYLYTRCSCHSTNA